jgi:hypothetical protein
MFAISLVLVVLISAAILLYQYWSGTLADRAATGDRAEGAFSELHPAKHDEHPTPARAA